MIESLAENLWLIRYPLPALGADLRRNVTLIRLASGELVIHSTGPFKEADVEAIAELGKPTWLLDAMLRHDTFADEGRVSFPEIPYLAPPGFSKDLGFDTMDLIPPPPAWGGELEVLEVQGVPSFREHVFFHSASRTLIVADLAFNFGSDEPLWTELLLKVAVDGHHHPGMSRPFKSAVKDEAAFIQSMGMILNWDFDRVIPGHGDVIESGGKEKISAMLTASGFKV